MRSGQFRVQRFRTVMLSALFVTLVVATGFGNPGVADSVGEAGALTLEAGRRQHEDARRELNQLIGAGESAFVPPGSERNGTA